MSYFTTLEEKKSKEIFPGFTGRFEHTKNITLAFWDVTAGSSVPEHSHMHEQVVTVREGKLELVVNGESRIMDAGCVAVIPSDVKHAAYAVTNCKLLDVFHPVREDYRI